MTTQNNNPFVLPGMGQSGELGQNPLLASMEMMRQAWQGMAGSGALAQSSLATPMSLEDLDRRIADLRTIENWLRLNLTMLSGTIQGLEVQRATIATLKSFVATTGSAAAGSGQSPLEAVLGIKPAGQGNSSASKGTQAGKPAPTDAKEAAASGSKEDDTGAHAAASGWWSMLQKQFDALAAATAATMQSAEAAQAAVQPKMAEQPAATAAPVKTAVKSTAKAAAKAAPRKRTATASKKTRA